ncbi:hypothetical protein [Sphaerisporangium fuscum]|uniref:hypothetical protein n=1 Tax=Sphaerisporangium fuscum TaxID=2835868 RepID=UPI001BDCCFA6|nr:hypothetical protein [Sphaerisporangium fuscum]
MRQHALSRRAVLRGTAAGVVAATAAGCSKHGSAPPAVPEKPDLDTVLLTSVIADKEHIVTLYRQAALSGAKIATVLLPFQQRHEAHLAELRRRLPAGPSASPASGGTPPASPAPSASANGRVSIGTLRELERKAAAARPRQIGGVSPALAQLLACIGACEAAHALALARES